MEVTTLWSHNTALVAAPDSVKRARDFVCSHLGEHQLPHLIDDIQLAVSELATNATVHARTPFTVTLDGLIDSVLLTVQDDSPSSPTTRTASVMAADGRGLAIVARLSRDWGVTTAGPPGRKSVWASFDAH
jgi:anti-sigma regulatory factor (Ser/Thr protein kinase)